MRTLAAASAAVREATCAASADASAWGAGAGAAAGWGAASWEVILILEARAAYCGGCFVAGLWGALLCSP
jgi:hypothetical protein